MVFFPYSSSNDKWRSTCINSWCSFWPWISTRCWPISLSVVALTKLPLTRMTLRPLLCNSRWINNWLSSSGIPNSSSNCVIGWPGSTSIKPCKTALSAPSRMKSCEPRPPVNRPTASIIIDFPAPVSPVKTVIPGWKLMLSFGIIAKFWIDNSCSIACSSSVN